MVLWMAVNDLNMSAVLLYQLFRYLWAVSRRRGVRIILVLAKQKVEQWELIGLWLSCEVERCIMQDEPDPPLPETVDGGCWPAYWWPHSTFFFARVSTGPNPRCEDFGAVAGHWSMQNLSSKKQPVYWCCCPQSGAHRMQTQCSEETTDLGPPDRTVIQGRAPLILMAWTACAARVYLGLEGIPAKTLPNWLQN